MSFASAVLYPFLLLVPAVVTGDAVPRDLATGTAPAQAPADALLWPALDAMPPVTDVPLADGLLPDVVPKDAWQMRIEQRMTIRITPRTSVPMPQMFVGLPGEGRGEIAERRIGKCLPVGGIVSVRPDRGNRLLLLMRDSKVVSAELDRSCRARDFYSGFLIKRSEDGRLCVDRDTLLSRGGMSCHLTRIRQLVAEDR